MQKILCKKHTNDQTGHQNAVPGIPADIRRLFDIFLVVAADHIHHSAGYGSGWDTGALQVRKEIALQTVLIFPVGLQLSREAVIVGGGKCVYGVVYQLAHCVVVENTQLPAPLKTAAEPGHIAAGIAVVMSSQPLAADGALQVGGRIDIGLCAAQLKC